VEPRSNFKFNSPRGLIHPRSCYCRRQISFSTLPPLPRHLALSLHGFLSSSSIYHCAFASEVFLQFLLSLIHLRPHEESTAGLRFFLQTFYVCRYLSHRPCHFEELLNSSHHGVLNKFKVSGHTRYLQLYQSHGCE
jgi:hypothetical protein